jgi:hypothetical protein
MDPLKRAIAEAQTPEWREKFAKDQRFLSEVVYAGLTDLNSGFDSPGVSHYSPKNFLTIIDRCEALKVRIIGIEIFRVGPREVGFLGCHFPRGYQGARQLVREYIRRRNITISATFNVPAAI